MRVLATLAGIVGLYVTIVLFYTGTRVPVIPVAYFRNNTADSPKFLLIRCLSNDIPFRHAPGMTLRNLEFILSHEPAFLSTRKVWLINRIVDQNERSKIVATLKGNHQLFWEIPFNHSEYSSLAHPRISNSTNPLEGVTLNSIRIKLLQPLMNRIQYVTNNNAARNAMLDFAASHFPEVDWVLPFDGSVSFTKSGWNSMLKGTLVPGVQFIVVPMYRIKTTNSELLADNFTPDAQDEPQLVFHRSSAERYNTRLRYGRLVKVDMLSHLCVEGPWNNWSTLEGEEPMRQCVQPAPLSTKSGWVARLESGMPELESEDAIKDRGVARDKGIMELVLRAENAVYL